MNFSSFLQKMVQEGASDLFITHNAPICIKKNKTMMALTDSVLDSNSVYEIVMSLMNEKQKIEFNETNECNFALQVEKIGRFRVNIFKQKSQVGSVIRRIEEHVPTLEELDLPESLKEFSMLKRGLILVVGATGAGKSTTLAAMINHRNITAHEHIIAIEDPIEYIHKHKKSIITQREIGIDTENYDIALQNALRQAPDVILIGEVRSKESMEYAVTFAETGHLCLATLHANNANQTLERVASFFPKDNLSQLWMDLSINLRGVVAQQLIPGNDGKQVAAMEIMKVTPVIAEQIRKGEIDLIKEFIEKGENEGMITFDKSLLNLYKAGKITAKNALKHADSENDLRIMIKMLDKQTKGNKDDGSNLTLMGDTE